MVSPAIVPLFTVVLEWAFNFIRLIQTGLIPFQGLVFTTYLHIICTLGTGRWNWWICCLCDVSFPMVSEGIFRNLEMRKSSLSSTKRFDEELSASHRTQLQYFINKCFLCCHNLQLLLGCTWLMSLSYLDMLDALWR